MQCTHVHANKLMYTHVHTHSYGCAHAHILTHLHVCTDVRACVHCHECMHVRPCNVRWSREHMHTRMHHTPSYVRRRSLRSPERVLCRSARSAQPLLSSLPRTMPPSRRRAHAGNRQSPRRGDSAARACRAGRGPSRSRARTCIVMADIVMACRAGRYSYGMPSGPKSVSIASENLPCRARVRVRAWVPAYPAAFKTWRCG